MARCRECGEDAEELLTIKVDGKTKKACEECVDRLREAHEIAELSESAVQDMMGFKGRR